MSTDKPKGNGFSNLVRSFGLSNMLQVSFGLEPDTPCVHFTYVFDGMFQTTSTGASTSTKQSTASTVNGGGTLTPTATGALARSTTTGAEILPSSSSDLLSSLFYSCVISVVRFK